MKPKRKSSNNRVTSPVTPVVTSPVTPVETPTSPVEVLPVDTIPSPVVPQEDYTLRCVVTGNQTVDGDKWRYHKPIRHAITFDLRDDEGGFPEEHVLLSIGSSINQVYTVTVNFKRGDVVGWARAFRSGDEWKVNGKNSLGEILEGVTLTVEDKEGNKVPWNSKVECNTARYVTRSLIGKVKSQAWKIPPKEKESRETLKSTNEKLTQTNEELNRTILALQAQMAELMAKMAK